MMLFKRFSTLVVLASFAISAAMGQSSDSSQEMSIEESYLQEAIEMMIIRETSRSDSRDQKLIALEHIGNAIERGSTNEELRVSLEYLSLEGTQNRVRMGGRQMNNFPDIRRQAVKHLGSLGTPEAKSALLKVCQSENEPMVLQEVIKSLGSIGLNDNDDTIHVVVWVANRNNNTDAPDAILALAAIDTLDKLAEKYRRVEPNAIQLIGRIMEGPYPPPIRERAKQVLLNLRKYMVS